MVRNLEVNQADLLIYDGDNDLRKVSRDRKMQLLDELIADFVDESIPEINTWEAFYNDTHIVKRFYSGKGATITQDRQACTVGMLFKITVDGVTTSGGKHYQKMDFDGLLNHSQEIISERDRALDFARNAVDVTPGDYTCVLAPVITAMFTHESFGHKSEADFMLNDQTLRDEWVMGKTVGNEKVSICDSGEMQNHGYTPFDDEGTRARETWLIKNGVLTGRLHDAHSAAVLFKHVDSKDISDGWFGFGDRDFKLEKLYKMAENYLGSFENEVELPEEIIVQKQYYDLYGKLIESLNAEKIALETSLLSGKVGEKVFSEDFTARRFGRELLAH